MSDRRLTTPDRALAETYEAVRRRSDTLARRATWQAPVRSDIEAPDTAKTESDAGDAGSGSWPDNAIIPSLTFTLELPAGRWAVTFAATHRLEFTDCYSGWVGTRVGVDSVGVRDLFAEVPAPASFSRTMRSALSVESDGTTSVFLSTFFGYLTAGGGLDMDYTLQSYAIIAYPG